MVREPEEVTKKKGAAHARAVRTVLDRHRPEFNEEKRKEMKVEGFDWTPSLTPEERAAKEDQDRKAKAIQRAQAILEAAKVPMVIGLDPAGDVAGGLVVGVTAAAGRGLHSAPPVDKEELRAFIAEQHVRWTEAMRMATSKVEPFENLPVHLATALGMGLQAAREEEDALAELLSYGVAFEDAPRVLAGIRAAKDGTFQGVKFDWDRPSPSEDHEAAVAELIANGVPPEEAPHVARAIKATFDGTGKTVQVDWKHLVGEPGDSRNPMVEMGSILDAALEAHDELIAEKAGLTDPEVVATHKRIMTEIRNSPKPLGTVDTDYVNDVQRRLTERDIPIGWNDIVYGITIDDQTLTPVEISRDDPRFIKYDPEKVVAKQEWHGDGYDIIVPANAQGDVHIEDLHKMPEGYAGNYAEVGEPITPEQEAELQRFAVEQSLIPEGQAADYKNARDLGEGRFLVPTGIPARTEDPELPDTGITEYEDSQPADTGLTSATIQDAADQGLVPVLTYTDTTPDDDLATEEAMDDLNEAVIADALAKKKRRTPAPRKPRTTKGDAGE